MIEITIFWFISCFFSFGLLGLNFLLMKRKAQKSWELDADESYMPTISVLVPTYNESQVIRFKLENLSKIEYPRDLVQTIVVDSKSVDETVRIVKDFAMSHPKMNIQILEEAERKGKTAALNSGLKVCKGDVIVLSDADCFWPADILIRTMPFLADSRVGAITGPKLLLNPAQSWTTKSEDSYLDSVNLIKLGESKIGSTVLFEGGFSAYKHEILESFDPYNTGSDDCGTLIALAEKGSRAIFVAEGSFYTTFPTSWRGRVSMKVRRSGQLVRVFWRYLVLLLNRRIETGKRTIVTNILIYLFGPIFFVLLLVLTAMIFIKIPCLAALLLLFVVPKIGPVLIEAIQGFLVLFCSLLTVLFRISFLKWGKPSDRYLLTEDILRKQNLI